MTVRLLASFALQGLWRQKVRTALTLIGVMVGTCALAFSLALGFGLRAFVEHEFKAREDFWRVVVTVAEPVPDEKDVPPEKSAVKGEMSAARRDRLREALIDRYMSTRHNKGPLALTPDKLAAIAALPDVIEVRTYRGSDGRVTAAGAEKPAHVLAISGPLTDLQSRLLAGRLPANGSKEVVVSEMLLYDLGFRDDADLERALGKPMLVTVGGIRNAPPLALAMALLGRLPGNELTTAQAAILEKLASELPKRIDSLDLSQSERAELKRLLESKPDPDNERPFESGATASDTFRVCGVVRVVTRADRKKRTPLEAWELVRGDAFLSPVAGDELFARLPWARAAALHSADVRVRPGGDLPGTAAAIDAMGFRTVSGAKWFASAKREVTLIAAGLNLFAMIALLVAAIGITNTLVTSVVERTKEIGILRAVGATRGQILGLFLAEGMLIGLVGSLLGLGLARGLAVPADRWVWGMIEKIADDDKLMGSTVFVFPLWLYLASVLFAVLVTTAAAYYPAPRREDPPDRSVAVWVRHSVHLPTEWNDDYTSRRIPSEDFRMTPPTTFDPSRTKLIYDFAADRYLRSLPPEHFMEATPQATQREITLESFALIRVSRPEIQCFNELLVQYPRSGQDPDKPGQIVPDNMIVVHHEPIKAMTNFATLLQPAGPFLVLEYVSKYSVRKDYEVSYEKYEKELRVPYYLVFYPDAEELTLFRLAAKGYAAVHPNSAGRLAIPELDLEVALLDGWVRYWFRGELLPLPGELLRQLNAVRTQFESARAQLTIAEQELIATTGQLTATKGELTATKGELTTTKGELTATKGELTTTKGELTATKGELTAAKGEVTAVQRKAETERQARLAAEAELAKLREELSRSKKPGA